MPLQCRGDETFPFPEEVVVSVGEMLELRLGRVGQRREVIADLGAGGLSVWETLDVHSASADAGGGLGVADRAVGGVDDHPHRVVPVATGDEDDVDGSVAFGPSWVCGVPSRRPDAFAFGCELAECTLGWRCHPHGPAADDAKQRVGSRR